jgi:hypothetical protein
MTLAIVRAAEKVSEEPIAESITFDDFWTLYPRHEAKKDARRSWDRMTPDQQQEAVVAIFHWRRVWAAQMRDQRTTPMPATWLNGERWEDELPPEHRPRTNGAAAQEQPRPVGQRTEMPQYVRDQIAKLRAGK